MTLQLSLMKLIFFLSPSYLSHSERAARANKKITTSCHLAKLRWRRQDTGLKIR